MALARVTTWNPGDVLTAAALNGEFNSVLNNPVALISPTTGAINFNLQAHTGLRLENLAVDPASTSIGRIFFNTARNQAEVDDGTIIRALPSLSATAISSGDLILGSSASQFTRVGIGTAGQVFNVTSSLTLPSWSTFTIAAGTLPYYSTAATPILTNLAIGTSGQTLQVSTALAPTWVTVSAAAAAAGGGFTSSSVTYYDTFQSLSMTALSTGVAVQTPSFMYVASGLGAAASIALSTMIPGGLTFPSNASSGAWALSNNSTAPSGTLNLFLTSLQPDMTINILSPNIAGVRRVGMSTGDLTIDPTNGIYFRATAAGSTWFAVSRNAGSSFTIATTAVNSSSFQTLRIQVTSSGTGANVYSNTVLAGTAFTSSQLPATGTALTFGFGFDTAASTGMVLNAWQIIQNRPATV